MWRLVKIVDYSVMKIPADFWIDEFVFPNPGFHKKNSMPTKFRIVRNYSAAGVGVRSKTLEFHQKEFYLRWNSVGIHTPVSQEFLKIEFCWILNSVNRNYSKMKFLKNKIYQLWNSQNIKFRRIQNPIYRNSWKPLLPNPGSLSTLVILLYSD